MNRRFISGLTIILALGFSFSFKSWGRDNSLVLHLSFDRVTAGGNETPDSSGNRYVGRLHGQKVVPGIVGSALEFLGFDQIVQIGDLKIQGPATVAFWIRTNDLIRNRRLLSQLDGGPNQSGALRLDGGQLEVASGQDWRPLVTKGLRFDQWMHIAVVFDDQGKATGYLNGQAQETVAAKCDYSGVRAGIGAKSLGNEGNPFTGLMDDFRFYSKALSPSEITGLYDLGSLARQSRTDTSGSRH